ncbi:TonB family protein [Mastigocladopsis repens]|uniref:TonB family protein n=1 Tax=Mastigocladopsis repens TaxID=221287 RepID=UPI0003613E60|nr:TonB family protein [Mastigocladopsis repens]
MAKSHRLQHDGGNPTWRSAARGERPETLVLCLVTSFLLHSVLFLGSNYWLRAFAPKQEVSEAIPIEYVEVPPDETKTPPETSRRAAKDSVAGGKSKPERPISAAKSAYPTAPKASTASEPSEVFLPEGTPQKAVSPNLSPQKLQPKPPEIAVAPTTKQPEPPPQTTVTPTPKPPEPEPSPTAVAPATKPLALKLQQRTVAPTKPPEPEPSPTAVAPTTTPLALKLRQRTVAPTKPPEPEPSPTAVAPATKPLALKPRQTVVPRTPAPSEPEPSPTIVAPTPKPPEPAPSATAVTPTTKPPEPKPRSTVVTPATTSPALKPRQTAVTPTTKPPASLTRQGNRDQLAAKSSPRQLETRTTSRKPSQVQPSPKSGGASSLGGPLSLSNRDLGSNELAALPNSNRLNRSTEGIDARQDADLGSYLKQLQEQVRQQWIPGLTQSSRRTVLHFTVSRSGLVSNLRIAQTSGLTVTDEAALSAVKRAAPFVPLPTAYTENYINIQFTFNINVYGELELWRGGQ